MAKIRVILILFQCKFRSKRPFCSKFGPCVQQALNFRQNGPFRLKKLQKFQTVRDFGSNDQFSCKMTLGRLETIRRKAHVFLRNNPSYRNKQKINDSNLIQLFNLIKLDNGSESRFDILESAGFCHVMMTHQSYCQK